MISDLNIHVNSDLCIACGICVDRCIMDNLRLNIPPCRIECPLHMNCQGYIRLLARGKGGAGGRRIAKIYAFRRHPRQGLPSSLRIGLRAK